MSQVIVSGIITGSLYALAALGLVLIFKTSDVVNFAQGEMAMFCTFIAYTFMTFVGLPYYIAFPLTIICAGILGVIVYRLIIKPLSKSNVLSIMIATLGLIMILNGLAGNIFGFETKSFPKLINAKNINILGVSLEPNSLLIVLITFAVMLSLFFYFKTMEGIAIRAVAQDVDAAKLMGISVKRVTVTTWIISSMLAATAGMLIAPTTFLDINMMSEVHLKSFCAAVLGGFNTFVGPAVGGVLIGILENLVGKYISLSWKTVFAFILIIVMLVVRPNGLCGKSYRRKV